MRSWSKPREQGLGLIGLLFILLLMAGVGLLMMRLVPSVTEYYAIKKAIVVSKDMGATPNEIRSSFDKQAQVDYIETIQGKDLLIARSEQGLEVGFSYEKKIRLVGPASLVIDYRGATSPLVWE